MWGDHYWCTPNTHWCTGLVKVLPHANERCTLGSGLRENGANSDSPLWLTVALKSDLHFLVSCKHKQWCDCHQYPVQYIRKIILHKTLYYSIPMDQRCMYKKLFCCMNSKKHSIKYVSHGALFVRKQFKTWVIVIRYLPNYRWCTPTIFVPAGTRGSSFKCTNASVFVYNGR